MRECLMWWGQSSLTSSIFAIVCGMVLLTSAARAEDEPLPPEVKKLIGMKIAFDPKRGSKVPEWERFGSHSFIGIDELGVDELYQKNISIFAVISLNRKKGSETILDVRVFPPKLMSYSIKNGSVVLNQNKRALHFSYTCKRETSELIVALMRPEPEMEKENCTHWSKDVKRAWSIDRQTGHLTEVPTQDVSCYWDTEFFCLSNQD